MRIPRKCLFALLAAVALSTLSGAVVYFWPSAPEAIPLSGHLHHDFGEVRYSSRETLDHVFVLRNVLSEVVTVSKVVSSCGCVAAEPSVLAIRPGGETSVKVSLKSGDDIPNRSTVWLVLEKYGAIPLTVTARPRRLHSLYSAQRELVLPPRSHAEILLIALDYKSGIAPDAPHIVAPNGVVAETSKWMPVLILDEELGRPSRWQATVRISTGDEELPVGARLHVTCSSGEQTSIPLRNARRVASSTNALHTQP
jgi:hypothetical protein